MNPLRTHLATVALLAILAGAIFPDAALHVSDAAAKPHLDETARFPNILFMISDDLTAEALGCYGNTQCQTPNIDRLAAKGVRFTRAYCQFAVCGGSRSSMMSGLFPQSIGVITNPEASDPELFTKNLGDRPSMSQLFKRNGYFTARVSKVYHMRVPGDITMGIHGPDHAPSWTERYSMKAPEQWSEGEHEHISNEELKFDRNEHYGLGFGWAFYAVKTSSDGPEQADVLAADKAIELLHEHGGRETPFFLAVGFARPHVPHVAPPSYFDRYPPEQIDVHEVDPARDRGSKSHGLDSRAKKQRVIAAYYASTSFMDAQVGRLLDALDATGARENTIVIFTSDHGFSLGNQGRWGKGGLHEETARVPLIVDAPDCAPSETGSLVQLVDLYPTLAELAGLAIPEHVQGESFAPVLREPARDVHEFAYTLAGKPDSHSHLIRTKRRAFMTAPGGSMRLHDMDADPEQIKNLANDSAQEQTIAHMKVLLKERLKTIAGGK